MLAAQWRPVDRFRQCFLTTTEWIAMTFRKDIHGAQVMHPIDFGDPLTFLPEPSSGQNVNLSNKKVLSSKC